MWYLIHAHDHPDSLPLRQKAREAHLERLRALQEEGRLLTAGPLPAIDAEDPGPAGFAGSLVVAEFDSLEAARTWAGADPYVDSGAYRAVEVLPYKPVFPL